MNPLAETHIALADPDLKRDYNRHLFKEVAPRYDLITRMLSFGRDAAWKKWMIGQLSANRNAGILDLACGTGDITRALALRFPEATVTGLDLSPEMLEIARRQAPESLHFVQGDMTNTGRENNSCEIVTGGYALRNAPELSTALSEVQRILIPGGLAAFLDFSASANFLVRKFHYALLWTWGALWGLLLHGDPRVYAYIARSLAHFPDRLTLHRMFETHGLAPRTRRRFMFGLIEVVICEKSVVG
ncbi:MAG: ubiquinone/menaquinone biosynthesis methyltransferase [Kiritimatiellia bacterium]